MMANRVLAPMSSLVARDELYADARLGNLRPIAGSERQYRVGCPLPDSDSVRPQLWVSYEGKVFSEFLIKVRRL